MVAKKARKSTAAKRRIAAGKSPSSRRRPRSGQPPVRPARQGPITIVGVGASAGGLEAFSALLRGIPAHPNIAIVFVQHLAPTHDSALVTLLSAQTVLPVVQVDEGMRVETDHVYVIPPNVQMAIDGRDLHLKPRPDDRSRYTPIDAFFASLAQAAGGRAIGIVLSGTASDGALGVRDIKAAGGVTIAQLPTSAKYEGMPRAAIATGVVDLVLTPEAIGQKIAQLSRHDGLPASEKPSAAEMVLSDAQLKEIFDLLRPASGVDFRHYKLPTIKRRLFRRMALHRINDVAEYVRLLRSDAAELWSLYQDLLIHVTRFFREPESFEAMAREVFPALVESGQDQPIRVWVSGCATGEEAYSIGIALTEYLQRDHAEKRIQIFATDVSETAVEQARTGVYPASIEEDVTPDRLRRFFTRHDGGYRVSKMIRDLCVFARQDLTKDPPFSRLDLILCRNVLIYMDALLQKKLLSVFHYALHPDGFLVLGHAETVGSSGTLFSLVDKKFRIHRKKATQAQPTMNFPLEYASAAGGAKRAQPESADGTERLLLNEVNRILMDRFAPPGVVVDADMQIVQFRGQTGAFLEPAPGEASLNLLKMTREGLLYGLRTALNAARKSRTSVQKDGLQVRVGQAWRPVSIEIIPLASTGRAHYLVLFDDRTRKPDMPAANKPALPPPPKRAGRDVTQRDFLQRELAASRDYLQSIIQELEAANEELQSANEEILSSNEELQSTNEELDTAKEELQSTNEELNTVNEEMHGRNEELSRVNSDLINLLGSVQIAIVIVSSDLRIRRFTPMAEKVLNLISADVDRPIAHIKPNLDDVNLEQLITECIDSIALIDREVRDREGRWYSLRVRPYRSVENRIDGAVLSLFDIDAPKRSEEMIRTALAFADVVLQSSSMPMAVLDESLSIKAANEPFAQLLAKANDGLRGRELGEMVQAGSALDELRALLQKNSRPGGTVNVELQLRDASQRRLRAQARVFSAYDAPSRRALLLTAVVPGES